VNPPLYEDVLQLSLDIVNASEVLNKEKEWNSYQQLKELCEINEKTTNNHPIQWEALADFTPGTEQAIYLYKKALQSSEKLGLNEYSASINLAMAERHYESGNKKLAFTLAHRAGELAESSNDTELRKEISEFLLTTSST